MKSFEEILKDADSIYGFLRPAEALHILNTAKAKLNSGDPYYDWIEIGSWCGKSTVLWGEVIRGTTIHLYAIDPHLGTLSHPKYASSGSGRLEHEYNEETPATLGVFTDTLTKFGLHDQVVTVVNESTKVKWVAPIGLIFIDGLHSYESVKADYEHFQPNFNHYTWVVFHDLDWEGPHKLVHEKIDAGELEVISQADSLMVTKYVKKVN